MNAKLTASEIEAYTEAMKNAKDTLERQQKRPLSLAQAEIFHNWCVALDIDPLEVLAETSFIEQLEQEGMTALEQLEKEPGFLLL